jgi:hypothetical protein
LFVPEFELVYIFRVVAEKHEKEKEVRHMAIQAKTQTGGAPVFALPKR